MDDCYARSLVPFRLLFLSHIFYGAFKHSTAGGACVGLQRTDISEVCIWAWLAMSLWKKADGLFQYCVFVIRREKREFTEISVAEGGVMSVFVISLLQLGRSRAKWLPRCMCFSSSVVSGQLSERNKESHERRTNKDGLCMAPKGRLL